MNWSTFLPSLISAAFAAGGAYAATRVHLSWLRKDVDRAQATADRANERIDELHGVRA
jgi:hypothetical protein